MDESKFSEEFSGILSSIDSKGFRDDIEGFSEFRNGELFSAAEGSGVMLEVDASGDLHAASSDDEGVRFEDSLDGTKGVMDGAFDFIEHEFIGSSEEEGLGLGVLSLLEEDEVIVSDSFFADFFGFSEEFRVDLLLAVFFGEGDHDMAGGLGDSSEILLVESSHGVNFG